VLLLFDAYVSHILTTISTYDIIKQKEGER